MDLGFTENTLDGTPVLAPRGDADLATLPALHERVSRFAAEHRGRRAVIDLDGLDSLDPITIGVLVAARLQLRSAGGELELVCTSPALVGLFEASGLDAAFTLHATVAAATERAHPPPA